MVDICEIVIQIQYKGSYVIDLLSHINTGPKWVPIWSVNIATDLRNAVITKGTNTGFNNNNIIACSMW